MPDSQRAIIAGSAGFVQAVQPQLQLRLGAIPAVASDPAEALRAAARAGLLVVECADALWVDAVRSLREQAAPGALSIVAAVPPGSAGEVQPLKSAGADEIVAWQGRADPVLWAVERVVARARVAGSAPPRAPAVPAPPRSAPGPAVAAAAAALRAMPVAAPTAAPIAAAPPPRPAPVNGGMQPVAPPRLAPSPASALALAPAREPSPAAPDVPFDVLEVVEDARARWPGAVPSASEAEALLAAAVAGELAADAPLRAVAEDVARSLTSVERGALSGASLPGGDAVRAAAAQRLRVAEALGTVPASREASDASAAQRLLAEVDGALAAVSALVPDATPEVARELGALRHALVDGGVKLADALSRLSEPGAAAAPAPAEARPSASARVLCDEAVVVRPPARKGMIIALAVVALLTALYHGARLTSGRPVGADVVLEQAPANTFAVARGKARMLMREPGRTVDPAELDAFRERERAKGNVVREIAAGTWVVEPAAGAGGSSR